MDRFEEKEIMKKKIIAKNLWYNWYKWLMNYIRKPVKKPWVVLRTIVWVFLKPKIIVKENVKTVYGSGKKPSKLRIQKQSEEENIIKNIKNLFQLKKENRKIQDRAIRDVKTLF